VTDKDLDMFVRSRKDVFTGEGARLDLASSSGKFGRPGECVCPRVGARSDFCLQPRYIRSVLWRVSSQEWMPG